MRTRSIFRKALFLGVGVLLVGLVRAEPGDFQQYSAAIHVHSSFSNGDYDVSELARLASERDLDVLVLTDSFLTSVNYGLGPLDRLGIEGLNRRSRPGVRDHGVDHYLSVVREVQGQIPDILLIPGVEVTPHYFWLGQPWENPSLHFFDRHLIVLGLSSAELSNLPVLGNETWQNTDKEVGKLVLPLLLLGVGGILVGVRRTRRTHLRYYTITRRQRSWVLGCLFLGLGVVCAWNNYPLGRLSDPRFGRYDMDPYQHLIDYVVAHGGVVYWSYPEARYPDVEMGGARMVSGPHPEDLLATHGYHGFEGLYGDTIYATRAGGIWDHLLKEYLRGARAAPPFVSTGINFHYFREGNGWYELDRGQTILLLAERTSRDVLDALREGRSYATFQNAKRKIRLYDFRLTSEDGRSAGQGQTLQSSGPVEIHVHLDWLSEPPATSRPFRLELISDGQVVETLEQTLPVRITRQHQLSAGRHYFRLRASSGRTYEVLSNPIVVAVQ